MPAVILRRIDPARNMHRYYRLDVQPDLFGEWGVVVRQEKLARSSRWKTGTGKAVAGRPVVSVAQASVTATVKHTQRSGGVWD